MLVAAKPQEPAISRELFLLTLAALQTIDVDAQAPLERLGLRIGDLEDLPRRLKPSVMHDLWDAVHETTSRSGAGIRIASRVRLEQLSTFGRVLATSATLGEALARGVRLFRLLSERQRFVLRLDYHGAVIALETHGDGRLHPEGAEMLMGALVTLARQLGGRDDPPTEVHFKHEPPSHRCDLESFFGCKVIFGSLEHTVVFSGEVLLWPVLGHDPELCASLQAEAEAMLSELTAASTFRRDVTDAIYREIGEGNTSIRRVAARLGMHPKALARALRADGTTYSDLMETVRLHLARRYLEQPHVSVTEVAFRLGYSEKSAFNRAFKRWTGQAPEDYRNDRRRSGRPQGGDRKRDR